MNLIQKYAAPVMLASALFIAPMAASAHGLNVQGGTGVFVGMNGIVRLIGATVTGISGNVINVATTIGNTVINWTVNTSADTKIAAGGSKTASTTNIATGDKLNIKGSLTGTSTNTVSATKVRDTTNMPFPQFGFGTVQSVNTANNSVVVKFGNNKTLTVQANTATVIMLNGATSTLASIQTGDKLAAQGNLSTDGSILTATKIAVTRPATKNDNDGDKDDNASSTKDHKGFGFGNFFGGLHFGFSLGHGKNK